MEWLIPVIVACVAAIPGVLAWWRGRNQDEAAARAAAKQARKEQDSTAVEGFARLVAEMRTERAADKQECERRIKQVRQDLLVKIVELESKLDECLAAGGTR